MRATKGGSSRATRHSRDLVVQIGKAQAAVEKALVALSEPVSTTTSSPKATRHSKDLVARLKAAAAALEKAHELALERAGG